MNSQAVGESVEQRDASCRDELRCEASVQGRRCRTPRISGDGRYCYWHSERMKEVRARASARGGRAMRSVASLTDLAALANNERLATEAGFEHFQAAVLRAVLEGRMRPQAARVALGIAREAYERRPRKKLELSALSRKLLELQPSHPDEQRDEQLGADAGDSQDSTTTPD